MLINAVGKRWPVEECHQQGKGQAGLDQHQVRLWPSFCRHTVLSMCAQALLAVAAARPAPAAADAPAAWRDTGKLPISADDQPPGGDPGLVKVSAPEARHRLRLATAPITTAAPTSATPGHDGDAGTRPAPDGTTTTPGSKQPTPPKPSRPKGCAM